MNPPETTAVVVTHNSGDHVADCLEALLRAGAEVRVVDNASTDGTVRLLARRFPEVALTANPVNVGFAAAVNQALDGVRTDTVLLVNPDCVVLTGTVEALVGAVRDHPRVGVAGPRILGPDGAAAISAHPFESWLTVLASRFGGSLLPVGVRRLLCGRKRRSAYDACRRPGLPVRVGWVSGACLAVRTPLLRQLGGLDEGYFMYYEDEELCLQSWRRGAQVLYLPHVDAVHIGGASSAGDPTQVWPHLYRSMLRYFARHHRRSCPLVRAAVLLRALVGVCAALVRLPGQPARARARLRAWEQIARIAVTRHARLLEGPRQPCTS